MRSSAIGRSVAPTGSGRNLTSRHRFGILRLNATGTPDVPFLGYGFPGSQGSVFFRRTHNAPGILPLGTASSRSIGSLAYAAATPANPAVVLPGQMTLRRRPRIPVYSARASKSAPAKRTFPIINGGNRIGISPPGIIRIGIIAAVRIPRVPGIPAPEGIPPSPGETKAKAPAGCVPGIVPIRGIVDVVVMNFCLRVITAVRGNGIGIGIIRIVADRWLVSLRRCFLTIHHLNLSIAPGKQERQDSDEYDGIFYAHCHSFARLSFF